MARQSAGQAVAGNTPPAAKHPRQAEGWRWPLRLALIAFGSLPLLGLGFADSKLGGMLASWFELQCQRDPARLWLGNIELPVCSRCVGLYLGLSAGALVARPCARRSVLLLWLSLGLFVMLLDVLTEQLGMRPDSSALRLWTGLLVAYPASVLAATGGRSASSLAASAG